eukprot:TRINITY_DN3964_c0_g1_i1.p2 TRINITY_DN3964_c0_g1~~TRINITY_DN3964_c0_g1_i1.p2  ORF type:complete len:174 (-),score=48.33 TRINITY_DN3964_c0_g1_i1:18-539(-)
MFFHIPMEKSITLEPRCFSRNIKQTLLHKLNQTFEGTCSGQHGFLIAVTAVDDREISKGKVHDDGTCTFTVRFKALVYRPFRGEVVDTLVTQVTKMGFFAEVGPMQIFVSDQSMPADLRFDEHSIPQKFVSEDGAITIKKDDEVRVKLVGLRFTATEIYAIGSIEEDYMGPIG